jgi:hypothetical protein
MQRFCIPLVSFEKPSQFTNFLNEPKESPFQTPLRIPLKIGAANLLLQIPQSH